MRSSSASTSACRIAGSVASIGSPLPKSISSTPSAARRRFACSSFTNGYVPVARRTGESCIGCIMMTVIPRQPDPALERGFIAAVLAQGVDPTDELAELRELARTALVEPIGEIVQHRPQPERRTYVGKGKLEELKRGYREAGAEVLLVDDELEPSQQRTLEDTLQARVVDRTQLILDIFAQHAVSAEGKLQVELAQLEYNLPRMRGLWQHLERLGGGVGTRGPGESQLETDRRLARRRITLLRQRLKGLERQRATRRKSRRRSETPTIALAGYTNVGKSTLLNALTGAPPGQMATGSGGGLGPAGLLTPYDEGARLAELYALGAPVDERSDRPEGVFVRARLPRRDVRRFARYLIAEPREASARSRA